MFFATSTAKAARRLALDSDASGLLVDSLSPEEMQLSYLDSALRRGAGGRARAGGVEGA